MAYFFGLNVGRNLTDLVDAEEAVYNLRLDPKDLDIIRDLSTDGVQRTDFRTLSGLDFDLEVMLSSLKSETSQYDALTTNFYDDRSNINTSINVNGQLAAAAIKYLFVDFADGNKIKTADISTSRVSSWSAFESPLTATSAIYYGGDVQLSSPIELTTLNLKTTPVVKRFESEVPTHKIKVKIGGEDVYLYAMKGIPLTFTGFFRYANISLNINSLYTVRPTWVVKNTSNGQEFIYQNRLNGTLSSITFNDVGAKERNIEIYYPIAGITDLSLPSINMVNLPSVTLPNLATLNISSNDFREFPDLSNFSNLQSLNISYNDLTRAQNPAAIVGISGTITGAGTLSNGWYSTTVTGISTTDLVVGMVINKVSGAGVFGGTAYITSIDSPSQITFNSQSANTAGAVVFSAQIILTSITKQIASRIPTSVRYLTMGHCFTGVTTGDLSSLTNLRYLNLYAYSARRITGTSPKVYPNNLEYYNIEWNYCTDLDISVQQAPKLKELYITDNRINNSNIVLDSADLEAFVSYYGNYLNIVDVSNKTKLKTYVIYSNGVIGTEGARTVTQKFDGCTALDNVTVMYTYGSGAVGRFPAFIGCVNLRSVDFYATQITDAAPGYVISASTFDSCRSTLQFVRAVSGNFAANSIFHPNAFKNMKSLYYVAFSSGKAGIAGSLPSFASAPALQYLVLYDNNLSGSIPDFSAQPNFYYLDLRNNNFSGPVPNILGNIFYYAYLADNNLNEFGPLGSSKLRVLQLTRNKIPKIPYIGNMSYLSEFYINNQKLDGARLEYESGSFIDITQIRYLDVSNNSMSEGVINQIIRDLNANYEKNKRGGVIINLKGNDPPSTLTGEDILDPNDDIPAIIIKLKKAGWSIQTG